MAICCQHKGQSTTTVNISRHAQDDSDSSSDDGEGPSDGKLADVSEDAEPDDAEDDEGPSNHEEVTETGGLNGGHIEVPTLLLKPMSMSQAPRTKQRTLRPQRKLEVWVTMQTSKTAPKKEAQMETKHPLAMDLQGASTQGFSAGPCGHSQLYTYRGRPGSQRPQQSGRDAAYPR